MLHQLYLGHGRVSSYGKSRITCRPPVAFLLSSRIQFLRRMWWIPGQEEGALQRDQAGAQPNLDQVLQQPPGEHESDTPVSSIAILGAFARGRTLGSDSFYDATVLSAMMQDLSYSRQDATELFVLAE